MANHTQNTGHSKGRKLFHYPQKRFRWPSMRLELQIFMMVCTFWARKCIKLGNHAMELKLCWATKPLSYVSVDIPGLRFMYIKGSMTLLGITNRSLKHPYLVSVRSPTALDATMVFKSPFFFCAVSRASSLPSADNSLHCTISQICVENLPFQINIRPQIILKQTVRANNLIGFFLLPFASMYLTIYTPKISLLTPLLIRTKFNQVALSALTSSCSCCHIHHQRWLTTVVNAVCMKLSATTVSTVEIFTDRSKGPCQQTSLGSMSTVQTILLWADPPHNWRSVA